MKLCFYQCLLTEWAVYVFSRQTHTLGLIPNYRLMWGLMIDGHARSLNSGMIDDAAMLLKQTLKKIPLDHGWLTILMKNDLHAGNANLCSASWFLVNRLNFLYCEVLDDKNKVLIRIFQNRSLTSTKKSFI